MTSKAIGCHYEIRGVFHAGRRLSPGMRVRYSRPAENGNKQYIMLDVIFHHRIGIRSDCNKIEVLNSIDLLHC